MKKLSFIFMVRGWLASPWARPAFIGILMITAALVCGGEPKWVRDLPM